MRKSPADTALNAIGARLEALQYAMGWEDQKAFATYLGLTPQAWNNWIHGRKRIGIDAAIVVAQRTGVDLDWIYRGDPSGVPTRLVEKLLQYQSDKKTA
jgi:transcriptional regulator with XRE-family HTH domain